MIRLAWACAILTAAGCDKGPSAPAEPETAAYDAWRRTQIPLPSPAQVLSLPGRLTIYPPEPRARNPSDFCEVFLNTEKLGRYRVGPMADGRFPAPVAIDITLRSGPNRIDLWDSSSDRNCRVQIQTPYGTEIEFHPTADGYEHRQIKRE